ncbi:SMP-30/gluconolactonase/LRE family protein [Pseudobacteriovorax antillogorgiicola]|uniref:Sugar lactone lactonase YvrE n=1 Tax=Pseudobacteriovorax antillogorgiicola TaxID=1513793 RepID=A0A1Y6BLU1_9BACT|nr:SMP-30/gluconolactonase/LRE family protein [Pseudobacteriovorax antillogorgiicola]TCS54562.1 sugar lactone lactonase YvrE [Pseudobacteriovorax antillogorgiicola]SMF18249.1 Sugar lactone lactonase YvrE [Pseudobacteriovorax antillogorgiicola]
MNYFLWNSIILTCCLLTLTSCKQSEELQKRDVDRLENNEGNASLPPQPWLPETPEASEKETTEDLVAQMPPADPGESSEEMSPGPKTPPDVEIDDLDEDQLVGGAAGHCLSKGNPSLPRPLALRQKFNMMDLGFLEGPVWHENGFWLYSDFNDFQNKRIVLLKGDQRSIFLPRSGSNGLIVDQKGDLVFAGDKPNSLDKNDGIFKVQVTGELAGPIETVVDMVESEGRMVPFWGPNDLVEDASGNIFFTDPSYNRDDNLDELGNRTRGPMVRDEPIYGLYVIQDGSSTAELLIDANSAFEAVNPNGLAISLDGRKLFLALNDKNKVIQFDLVYEPKIGVENPVAIIDIEGPDGIDIDALGNLWVTSHSGQKIEVYNQDLVKIDSDLMVGNTTNIAFGGSDGKTVLVTGNGYLSRYDCS